MAWKKQLEQAEGSADLVKKFLSEAKQEILSAEQLLAKADETANQHYRVAADRIADAQKQKASQRQIAKDIGKSAAYVNQLSRWRKDGYLDSPFGPQSKAARLRKKKRSVAPEHDQKESASGKNDPQADDEGAGTKVNKEKKAEVQAEVRKAKAEAEKAKADADKWKKKAKAAAQGSAPVPNFDPDDRDRLVKFLGMLGSDQDGERLNAAHKAEKLRIGLGVGWDELIVPARIPYAKAA
jgi:hypothetical protein